MNENKTMMNHIDEGTIHAWLDGALDATRAREIEAHVAQCSACAAAVAEARGLIAGSSRILLALDDVPSGVTPMRAPAAPRTAPTRRWRAAPWVTAIAAALVLAVGVTTWNRDAVKTEMTKVDRAIPLTDTQVAPAAPAAPQRSAEDAANPRANVATRVAAPAPASQRQPKSVQRERKLDNAADAAVAPAQSVPVMEAAAPPPEPPPGAMRRETAAAPRVTDLATTASVVDAVAGCYRIQPPLILGEARAAAVAGAIAGAAAGRAASPRAARAPARASAEFSAAPSPGLLRLDTLTQPQGRVARSAASDSAIGWWTRINADSVQVELRASGQFKLAAKDRVACPER